MTNINKLNNLVSGKSNWFEEAQQRRKNRAWLKHSQKIAAKVLSAIREKKIKQKELASMIGVSPQQVNKIVKGRENITLETITKLEHALEVNLIFEEKQSGFMFKAIEIDTGFISPPVWHVYKNKKEIVNIKTEYKSVYEGYSKSIVNEGEVNYG
jgi:transcriptional regulator with XRE-family HTH domain